MIGKTEPRCDLDDGRERRLTDASVEERPTRLDG
jgi:hypothetical protein